VSEQSTLLETAPLRQQQYTNTAKQLPASDLNVESTKLEECGSGEPNTHQLTKTICDIGQMSLGNTVTAQENYGATSAMQKTVETKRVRPVDCCCFDRVRPLVARGAGWQKTLPTSNHYMINITSHSYKTHIRSSTIHWCTDVSYQFVPQYAISYMCVL